MARYMFNTTKNVFELPKKKHQKVPKFNNKLDEVGPVDNIPSIDKLHHFVHFFLN